jgi:hypothetical protein
LDECLKKNIRGGNNMGKIRVRHGDNEVEIEGTDQFIKSQLELFYQRIGIKSIGSSPSGIKEKLLEKEKVAGPGKVLTPAEYYKAIGKKDGVSQVLIFGKYLEEYKNMTEFTQKDINRIVREAKLSRDIHGQYFTNAVKQGLLRKQGQKYSLTLSAEEVLGSMLPKK